MTLPKRSWRSAGRIAECGAARHAAALLKNVLATKQVGHRYKTPSVPTAWTAYRGQRARARAGLTLAPVVPDTRDQISSSRGLSLVSEPSDSEVVRRVLAGDGDAYLILVARYRNRFVRYALHMLGDPDEAEEALQEALVRAWRGLGRCRNPDRFDAWLFQILANRCRTRGGRRRRHEAVFVRQEHAIADATARSPMADDSEPDWSDDVHRALSALEPDQREAFLLKYVDELSYEEMASLTGIGVSALKMRVKRAADRLRLLLQERTHAE